MALDVATFLLGYPEFSDAPPSLIQAKLTDAIALGPPVVWGNADPSRDLVQQGVFLYAAHFLACSPFARDMKLVHDDGKTTLYSDRLATLKRLVASGARVL